MRTRLVVSARLDEQTQSDLEHLSLASAGFTRPLPPSTRLTALATTTKLRAALGVLQAPQETLATWHAKLTRAKERATAATRQGEAA